MPRRRVSVLAELRRLGRDPGEDVGERVLWPMNNACGDGVMKTRAHSKCNVVRVGVALKCRKHF